MSKHKHCLNREVNSTAHYRSEVTLESVGNNTGIWVILRFHLRLFTLILLKLLVIAHHKKLYYPQNHALLTEPIDSLLTATGWNLGIRLIFLATILTHNTFWFICLLVMQAKAAACWIWSCCPSKAAVKTQQHFFPASQHCLSFTPYSLQAETSPA